MKQRYTVSGFCNAHGISETSFYREVIAGRLRLSKRGHRTFVTRKEARRWEKERRPYLVNKNYCRNPKGTVRRRRTFLFGGCFKLFFRKWK